MTKESISEIRVRVLEMLLEVVDIATTPLAIDSGAEEEVKEGDREENKILTEARDLITKPLQELLDRERPNQ